MFAKTLFLSLSSIFNCEGKSIDLYRMIEKDWSISIMVIMNLHAELQMECFAMLLRDCEYIFFSPASWEIR